MPRLPLSTPICAHSGSISSPSPPKPLRARPGSTQAGQWESESCSLPPRVPARLRVARYLPLHAAPCASRVPLAQFNARGPAPGPHCQGRGRPVHGACSLCPPQVAGSMRALSVATVPRRGWSTGASRGHLLEYSESAEAREGPGHGHRDSSLLRRSVPSPSRCSHHQCLSLGLESAHLPSAVYFSGLSYSGTSAGLLHASGTGVLWYTLSKGSCTQLQNPATGLVRVWW
jgi:hypothetical protein